jgi:acetylornithine/succinyldiaminopimelate/putrescine aminotransferase
MTWAWLFGGLKMAKSIGAGLPIAAALSTQALGADVGRIKTVVGQASVVRGAATLPATPGQTLSELVQGR